jgi:hypothetical protein
MASLMRFTVAAIAALLLLAGCEPAPTDLHIRTEQIVVHSVLVEGAPTATVLLMRMETLPATGGMIGVPVDGATVQITAGADTVTLAQHGTTGSCLLYMWQPDTGLEALCYGGAVPGGIRAGTSYGLRIRLPDGRLITGSTTVPAVPLLFEPGEGATYAVRRTTNPAFVGDTLRVRWQGVAPGQRAELFTASSGPPCGVMLPFGEQFFGSIDASGRTAIQLLPMVGCPDGQWPASLPAVIALAVYDENYSRYASKVWNSSSVHHGDAAAGLEGAHGVFGATAQARRNVTFTLPSAQ